MSARDRLAAVLAKANSEPMPVSDHSVELAQVPRAGAGMSHPLLTKVLLDGMWSIAGLSLSNKAAIEGATGEFAGAIPPAIADALEAALGTCGYPGCYHPDSRDAHLECVAEVAHAPMTGCHPYQPLVAQ